MKTLTTLILTTLLILSTSAQARPDVGPDSRQTLGGPGPHWQTVGLYFGGWIRMVLLSNCNIDVSLPDKY